MAKIIDFKKSPVKRIKQELAEISQENDALRAELKKTHHKIGRLVGINEMLKLQLNDLLTNLNYFQNHLNSFAQNASKLKGKLPDLSEYMRSVEQPIRVDIDTDSEEIDLNLVDPNEAPDDPIID